MLSKREGKRNVYLRFFFVIDESISSRYDTYINIYTMITFSTTPELTACDTLIVPLFEAEDMTLALKSLPATITEVLTAPVSRGDIKGKKFEQHLLYAADMRIRTIGLGAATDMSVRTWKHAIGVATIEAEKQKTQSLGISVPPEVLTVLGAETLGTSTAIAVSLGDYAYDEFQSEDARPAHLSSCTLMGITEDAALTSGLEVGTKIAAGVNFTRHLGNTPPSVMTPALLASNAMDLAAHHDNLTVRVLERSDMQELGMGCLLGVAQGSELPPKFIIMEFMNGPSDQKPAVLIGKGITFDSGGLSLKPADYMTDMKFDMLGAGTALGIMHAAVSLDLKKNLVVLVPSAENMPSGTSFRPDDVLTAMNGKTVEIGNTDAEGRLILADALSYAAANYDPEVVIDFATLTGACVVALGTERSALFTPHDTIAEVMIQSATTVGEWVWRLPLGEEYTELMKSPVADISNISSTRYGGASTAAVFLEFFTLDTKTKKPAYPWAHFDLSSAYKGKTGRPWQRYGATGDVVQTVLAYLRSSK
jgi:leucyl aminopeptidase